MWGILDISWIDDDSDPPNSEPEFAEAMVGRRPKSHSRVLKEESRWRASVTVTFSLNNASLMGDWLRGITALLEIVKTLIVDTGRRVAGCAGPCPAAMRDVLHDVGEPHFLEDLGKSCVFARIGRLKRSLHMCVPLDT